MVAVEEDLMTLHSHYRSGKHNLGQDFFSRCLGLCTTYKRAVGYFSSSVLISWTKVLPRFAKGEAIKIKLLISPELSEQDKQTLLAIAEGESRQKYLDEIADRIVLDAIEYAAGNQTVDKRMRLFAWLVATGKLELKFAYPNHVNDPGIFHEKIGVFEFPSGHKVAFTGSANESEMGHTKNYESVDVFRSWIPYDEERVITKEDEFDEAWAGEATGLLVRNMSITVLKKIKAYSTERPGSPYGGTTVMDSRTEINKWSHQRKAIRMFLCKKRGILEMATGTGKTRTALEICKRLDLDEKIETIIIAVDGNDLLDQWYLNVLRELKAFSKKFTVLRQYKTHKEREYFDLNPSGKILIISRPELAPVLRRLNVQRGQKTLLVHDEVHRLGSPANRQALNGLSDHIQFCLGLSATPEREYDSEGTKFISEHVGPTIFKFGIERAIKRNILCPFDYHPIDYELTDEEKKKLKAIVSRFHASKNTPDAMSQEELWMALANVYKTSEAKIPLFASFIEQNPSILRRCIIFVHTQEYATRILNLVHRYNADFHTYFSGEDSNTLRQFANGELECLITCHRLSEGIDIRSLNNVILFASDRAQLELIQRIGRCLRSDPLNPEKLAHVIDFVRISEPGGGDEPTADEVRRNWLSHLSTIRPKEWFQ